MSLWYAQSGPRSNDTGQFRSRARLGTQKQAGQQYRSWYYDFVSQETGTTIKRTSYSVTISDSQRNRAEHLQGFSSLDQARKAAIEWIDQMWERVRRNSLSGNLGSIPPLPKDEQAQEK